MKTPVINIGIVCGHEDEILASDDAHCIECSDGVCDICATCFTACEQIEMERNPYNTNESSYWFDGTIKEFRACLGKESESWKEVSEVEHCPDCACPMSIKMLDDDVGCGIHEGYECPDCGYTQ